MIMWLPARSSHHSFSAQSFTLRIESSNADRRDLAFSKRSVNFHHASEAAHNFVALHTSDNFSDVTCRSRSESMPEISEASCRPWCQGPSGQLAAKLTAQLVAQLAVLGPIQLCAESLQTAGCTDHCAGECSAGCKAKQRS